MNIVLLEDEQLAGEALRDILIEKGHSCTLFTSDTEVLKHPSALVDVYLLDYYINGKALGATVAKFLRQSGFNNLIIMLTSESDEKVIVECFGLEIDDYLTKPLRIEELQARINRHLQKAGKNLRNQINHNDLIIDIEKKTVFIKNNQVHLTPSEYKILLYLIKNRGKIVSRQELINYINETEIVVGRRTIDTHVNSLRKKVPESIIKITAKRSFGYGIL